MVEKTHIGWKKAWQSNRFRSLFIFGAIGLATTIIVWPHFLVHIEKRNGIVLNDALLAYLPVKDVSVPIFASLWTLATIMLIRIFQQPKLFLMFLISYWMLFLLRMLTIQLFPFDPPVGLLKLKDPISNLFYGNGGVFITKDLFFSGHTATLFLIYLFLENKWEKMLALLASVAIAILVLFQHIHYSIDVLFAPVFAYAIYWIVQQWLGDILMEAKTTKGLQQKTLVN